MLLISTPTLYKIQNLLDGTSRNQRQHVAPNHADGGSQIEVVKILMKQHNAPEVNIDYLSDGSLEYKYFLSTFEEVVEKKISDPRGRWFAGFNSRRERRQSWCILAFKRTHTPVID